MQLDGFDRKIVAALAGNGRMTTVDLASRVGLSPSACTRRLQALEAAGVIAGYRAIVDAEAIGLGITAFVEITLDRQNDEALRTFERALADVPQRALLPPDVGHQRLSHPRGGARPARLPGLHAKVLGHLPGVARIESKFALREVIDRPLVPIG